MRGRGKVARNAVIAGRQEMTNAMRRTLSIGHGIEGADVQEAQIPGTKNAF